MEIGKIIATLRDAKGWSQTDLAYNSGLSCEIMGKYERGDAVPSLYATPKNADAFEVSFDYLVDEGQNAKFDKMTVQRLQDVEALNPTIKDKMLFFY